MIIKHVKSYKYAIAGFKDAFKHNNFRFELIVSILVVMASILFKITRIEWLVVILCIGFVLVTEVLNTGIEALADAVDRNKNEDIRIAKDVAALAVFMSGLFAAAVGMLIFLPYVLNLVKG